MRTILGIRLQDHPDRALQRHWNVVQIGLFLLPFSAFLGCVPLLVTSLDIWRRRGKVLIRQPLGLGFAALSLWLLLTACVAYNRETALLGLFNFLPFFIVFPALGVLIQTSNQLRRIAWTLVLTSIPVTLIGVGQLYLNWGGHPSLLWGLIEWTIPPTGNPPGRMASVFTYATVLASYFVMVFVMGLGLWIEAKRQTRHWYFLGSVVAIDAIALILTNSRNAWAIGLLACLAFALYQGWRLIVGTVVAIAGAVTGAAFAPLPFQTWFRLIVPAFFWARLNDQMYQDRPIAQLRSTQWKFAWSLIEQRPFTGWGLRNFTQLYDAQMHYWLGHPHNLLLMMSAEAGIPAALLLYGLVGWVMAQGVLALRTMKVERLIYFTFLMAFSACALFSCLDITLFDARINTMGWVLLAGIWGVANRSIQNENNRIVNATDQT